MAGDRQRYQQAMTQGAQFAWDSEWRAAIDQYEIARTEFPEDAVPYSHLGQAYFELGDYDHALKHYQQAARLNPQDTVTLGRIADILERKGQLVQAARTYMAVAESHLKRRELETALANWERATRLEPQLLGAHQRLALVYGKLGRLKDSIREHLALARIYQLRGDVRQAAIVCKAALEMDPDNPEVLAAAGLLRQGLKLQEPEMASTPEQAESSRPAKGLAAAVRAAASALESGDVAGWADDSVGEEKGSPVEDARQAALANLAGSVFEEDGPASSATLSKADRDALISKAIACQTRGEIDEAIAAYEKAIDGGVRQTGRAFQPGLALPGAGALGRGDSKPPTFGGGPGIQTRQPFCIGRVLPGQRPSRRCVDAFPGSCKNSRHANGSTRPGR